MHERFRKRKNKKPKKIIKTRAQKILIDQIALEIEAKKGKLCKMYARGIMKTSIETKHNIKNESKF